MELHNSRPITNPLAILREEFDDWAVVFDPDTGEGYGLNPVCLFIWKRLDGEHTLQDIATELREKCRDTPEDTKERAEAFIKQLMEQGLAGCEY